MRTGGACQLCEVIAYLHSQVPPILHCDIKPSNIMITPADDICVIDFNTSLVFSKGVLAIGATPGYAAPEQYTRPGASPDTIETVPLEETMPLRGYKDAFAYQNVRSNKDPSRQRCEQFCHSGAKQPMRVVMALSARERTFMASVRLYTMQSPAAARPFAEGCSAHHEL